MGRRKKIYPVYERIEILDIGAEGKAIAKHNDMVIFVKNAVPGDVVDLQVTKKRKSFHEAKAIHFHKYSKRRVKAFCSHFNTCGGCKWQDLPYPDQLFYKAKQVADQLQRIGGMDKVSLGKILPILPSKNTEYYRNKLEFTFSNNRWLTEEELEQDVVYTNRNALGFHIPGMFDKVLDIDTCYLQQEPSNKIRLAVRAYAEKNQLEFFDLRNQEGFLRNLIIRTTRAGNVMVILSFFSEEEEKRTGILNHLKNNFSEITSLMYVINPKPNDTISDLPVHCYSGEDHIIETLGDLKFMIGPKSFFQINPDQVLKLYDTIIEFANFTGNETVYDLYTGTGSIANYIARKCRKVVGIEQIPEAIEDARKNAILNGITNTHFFAGDMKDVLTDEFCKENGTPDIIILDPPRAGTHDKVIRAIAAVAPIRIIYVSCNPATQARDIKPLLEKYTVEKIQPLDMFPHTYHVENVISLRKA